MPENANKTVDISIDDLQYYMRRDDRMSLIEKMVRKTLETDHGMIDANDLLMFFE